MAFKNDNHPELRMSMGKTLIIVAAGLATGNTLYQLLLDIPQWNVALDRTWFQFIALVSAYYVLKITRV